MSRPLRGLLFVLGTLSAGLGIAGIILPLVPTTPLLLLSAYCYARSSERLHRWLLGNRWLGAYIRNYHEGRGMPRREKAVTLALLWLTIGLTGLLILSQWWARALLVAVAVGVTTYLLRLPTYVVESSVALPEESAG